MRRLLLAALVLAAPSVLAATAPAAPRWLEPAAPFGDVPASQDEAGAAMAQDGRIVFARIAPGGALEIRERPPGGPVGPPVTLADAAGAERLHVVVGADGTAAVLFDEEDERYVALRPPGGAWADPEPVGPSTGAEAIAPDGELWRVAATPA